MLWRRVFGLDVRSLAVMRVGLGLVLLGNLAQLAPDAAAFFSDDGLLPRAAVPQLSLDEVGTAPPYWCSAHMLSGTAWFQQALIGVAAVLAVGVTVGYRTPWALFGSWVLLVGLQARSPLILIGGDDVLRCLLFWSLFLPLGACWSLDAARAGPPQRTVCTPASAALMIQLACVYVFTGLLKSDPAWTHDFSALYLALAADHHTSAFGTALLDYPNVLRVLTAATLVLEVAGPLALFLPWRTGLIRTVVVLSFWGLHVGILATMTVGLFSPACMVYWCALLPAGFWDDRVWRRLGLGSVPESDAAPERGLSLLRDAVVLLLVSFVVLLNAIRLTVPWVGMKVSSPPIQVLGEAAQLNQFWTMFAPRPYNFGGWFDVRGTLATGEQVNLWQPNRPVQADRPAVVSDTYPNMRWRKAMVNLFERDCPTHARCLDAYLRRRWDAAHPPEQRVEAVEMTLVIQRTLPPGGPDHHAPPQPELLWRSTPADPPHHVYVAR
jgi:hypothetical protein